MRQIRNRQLRTRVIKAKDKLAEAYLALQKHDHQGAAKLLEATREECFVLIADIEHEAEQHEAEQRGQSGVVSGASPI